MHTYRTFLRTAIRNYVLGSTVAVFGVGGVFIFSTLRLSDRDMRMIAVTLLVSVSIMVLVEFLAARRHLQPIADYYREETPSREQLRTAYRQVHRLPALAVRRTMGPHLLGFMIPGLVISLAAILQGWLALPLAYVGLAVVGALLVAGMHAIFEFYLTTEAIRPLLRQMQEAARERHAMDLTLAGEVLLSFRKKALWSGLLVGTVPLVLFSLATEVRLGNAALSAVNEYSRWAGGILLVGVIFAAGSAWLLSRAVVTPMRELQGLMQQVQGGRLDVRAADNNSDEFSGLVAGFNHMVEGLRRREETNNQLIESYFTTLAAALDARDPYTAGHSMRVAQYSVQIGRGAGLPVEQVDLLNKSALLHDIGKIGIRDDVLLKEGKLTDEEFDQIKQHPVLGEAILKQIQPPEAMAPLLPGVRSHHERYDGRGYPDGLAGLEIPLFGRIMAVADAFDAMTSDRPYRQGMPVAKALSILEEGSGTQWDPQFVRIFVEQIRKTLDTL
ncbi:hypothetical protein CBW65_22405 [Tumebacillus avium]|uniref:HAMP domain-containing protein n=1 Tax=Tumebacillus avium TaxID=1903704 RepID=A0A1Y0IU04_9BACL|nr:HD domain-containing phosphohydrolase [Tumebacillus avium]ARU63439.1 hypothetical protein CBW65_22405 [Tumebacillus avium]